MKTTTVSDLALTTKTCVQISDSATLVEAVHALRSNGGLPLVVLHDGAIRGIVTERELVLHGMLAEGGRLSTSLCVGDVMTPVTVTITEDSTVADILPAIDELKTVVPVTRKGHLIGVIRTPELLRLVLDKETKHGVFTRAAEEAEVFLSAPIWQSLMNLLAEAGI